MPRKPRTTTRLMIAAAIMATPLAAIAQVGDDDLPVRSITLYRSGVGYFERTGMVDGDASIQLRFNTDQINDILKSLVLIDRGGGQINSVSYGSKEPLDRRLGSFGVNIADNPSMPELMLQLRGAPVAITSTGGRVTGTILGVEQRRVPNGDGSRETHFVTLVTSGGLKAIAIEEISAFDIQDPDLAAELNRALAAVAEYRADTTKTVDVKFSGRGAREVAAAYIHEMPVWKTSYRLVLPDSDTAGSVIMQGWAIVENTTDHDWTDVQLGLVSGRPVSFVMDLYEPLFTERPEVPVPTIPGVTPRAYAGGTNVTLEKQARGVTSPSRKRFAGRAMAPSPAMEADEMMDAGVAAGMADYAPQAQAQAGLVGEVFRYAVDHPVTIERQQSAMIPIINSNFSGRRVSIYNPADSTEHPMRGVEVTNDTDLQLLPGPISVFDRDAYAGDAQISHIGSGDKRLLSYAVDLDVGVITKQDNQNDIQRLRIVDGLIEQTFKRQNKATYAFENNDERHPRTVIIERPKIGGWDLVVPTNPTEETNAIYRFELDLSPGESDSLTVIQQQTYQQRVAVRSIDLTTAIAYQRSGKLSPAVLDVIREVARRQSEIVEVQRQISEADRQTQTIHTEQGRIRSNMGSINRTSDLYARYMQKLNEQETLLENLVETRRRLQNDLDNKTRALTAYLNDLDVE